MSREVEGRTGAGDRSGTDGGRARAPEERSRIRYEPADGDVERVPPRDDLEPNRVAVDRRTGADRRVADEAVATERRVTDRRAAEQQAREDARERRIYITGRATQAVDYLFYLLYGLLATRFVLALLGASEQAGFVQFVRGVTEPFYAPFANIVSRPAVNGGYLDFPLLIAVLAYALLHMAVRGLLRLIAGTRTAP